jgi:hypothetical protein
LDCSFAKQYLLCGNCDVAAHPYAHFHRRECWDQGFWKPIPPLLSIDQDGQPYDRGETRAQSYLACMEGALCTCKAVGLSVGALCRPLSQYSAAQVPVRRLSIRAL